MLATPDQTAAPVAQAGAPVRPEVSPQPRFLTLDKMRQQYGDYLSSKSLEIEEARSAKRYYHSAQWEAKEIEALDKRNQPVITYNEVVLRVDGTIGIIEKLRQDPKAFPRSPGHEEGAELSTAVLNYVLDQAQWRSSSPDVAHNGAVDGIGGIELSLEEGDHQDPDVTITQVDPRDFYYDPRSSKPDFSDARFMGLAKWVDTAQAIEMFPDFAEQLQGLTDSGGSSDTLGSMDPREIKWTNSRENRLRLVEHWYIRDGEWMFCFFSGELRLAEGVSPFVDEKGRTFCRFVMFSCAVDHDDDRYGLVRNLKGPQDEINHRRSKALHELNTRRIIMDEGAVQDIEDTRIQAQKADGIIVKQPTMELKFDDAAKASNAAGNMQMLAEAHNQIDKYGPNPALMGESSGDKSGRALAMLQQAGIAQIGPFLLRYKGWKIRVYRAIWNTIQRHWQAERWIRVTDDEGLAQFIQVNGTDVDPATGQPILVNALGNLDVDIILDEGPDQVNSMADAFDTLMALAKSGGPMTPQSAAAFQQVIIELSSLPGSTKKKVLGLLSQAQQPDPAKLQAQQVELAGGAAKVQETEARAQKHRAETIRTLQEASGEIGMPGTGPARPANISPDEVGFAMGPPHVPPQPPGPPLPPNGVPPGMMPPGAPPGPPGMMP